jgi:PhnB protein
MSNPIIQPYLFFGGRCEEALEFYQAAFGAQVLFKMRFNESPDPVPPGMLKPGFEGKIMHATVKVGDGLIMAADGCDEGRGFEGFNLSIATETPEEAAKVFAALSDGGQVNMPLMKTFWSPCFGMLKDKFGVSWMVTVQSPLPG